MLYLPSGILDVDARKQVYVHNLVSVIKDNLYALSLSLSHTHTHTHTKLHLKNVFARILNSALVKSNSMNPGSF